MAIRFSKVQAGDVLLDVHSERMGNTQMRELGVWPVRVLEVDEAGALVSWNSNKPTRYSKAQVEKLRRFAPEWLRRAFARNGRYYCYHCSAATDVKSPGAHKAVCLHPKAVAWRKRVGCSECGLKGEHKMSCSGSGAG